MHELGNCGTFLAPHHLVQRHFSDLAFLNESKLSQGKVEYIHIKLMFFCRFSISSRGKIDGLILLWQDFVIVLVRSFSDKFDASAVYNGIFIGFYANPYFSL